MIAYLDSSVLMRILLNQTGVLPEFSKIRRAVASRLLKTECLRVLHRCRLEDLLTEKEYLQALDDLYDSLDSVEFIHVTEAILERACASYPVALGTLDAIHLASALAWREQESAALVLLTHDRQLAKAARSVGFEVLG